MERLLALLLVHLADLVEHRVVRAHPGELHRVVALGNAEAAGRLDVRLGRAPHERDDFAQRIAGPLELLDRDRRRTPEQMRDHEIGPVALRDIEDLGAHLHARRRHREGAQLEAFLAGQLLEHRQRLLAARVVVEQISDLLALEISAQLVLDELDRGRALRIVGGGDGKQEGVAGSVGRRRDPEAGRGPGDVVLRKLLAERLGLRRAVQRDQHGALLLVALVGLHRPAAP